MFKVIALSCNVFVLFFTGYIVYEYGFPDLNDEKVVFFWIFSIPILIAINIIAIQQNLLPKKEN